MSRWRNCHCMRCRMRGLMGPIILITLGVLFFIGENWHYSFERSIAIILIVIGVAKILSETASTEGHVDPSGSQVPASASPSPPPNVPPPPPPTRSL